MSLLSRRKLVTDSKNKGGNDDDSSLSKRQTKPRRFQISRTTLDYPVLGGDDSNDAKTGSSKSGPFNSLMGSSSTSSVESSLFTPFATSSSFSISSISSTGSIYSSDRNKMALEAIASSKIGTVTSSSRSGGGDSLEPMPLIGRRQKKRMRKHEKSLTKGSAWFNMAKAEVTKEKKNDLEVLKLRSAMEGVLHYKRNNITHTPKYFHVGTVVESSADFYSSRIPKKQRKKTLAQEFASDFGMV